MTNLKIKEEYDGRLPIFNVVKEVQDYNNCDIVREQIIETFDTYELANEYLNKITEEDNDGTTPCGEENPCS